MRKIAFITVCMSALLVTLFSCNSGKLKQAEEQNQELRDSLYEEKAAQDSLLSLLTEVTDGMEQIKSMEKIINNTNLGKETPSRKEEIKNDMLLIARTLQARRDRIEELEKKLKKSGAYNGKMQKTIDSLKAQIDAQAAEIENLQGELKKANIQIEGLNVKVQELNTAVDSVTVMKEEAEQEAVRMANEMNTCYYVYGTNKELKEASVIQKKFLGKTKVMEGEYELSYFTKADKRTLMEIPLHTKKVKVWTKQAEESYEITEDAEGYKTLKITDPAKFWEVSNFLVIQVN